MNRGRFLTVEGGEGSGKSTQVERLAAALRARGLTVLQTREPGGAPGAEEIRRLLVSGEPGRWLPRTELLLHFAARCEHVRQTIEPALARGDWVVSDRFADSTLAYQGYGHALGTDLVRAVQRAAIGDFCPDLTLFLDVDVATGLSRARQRATAGEDRYERMDRSFHERVRHGFREIATVEQSRVVTIEVSGDPESVARLVWASVTRRFGWGDG
ncbi:MAG: dTMP kinase [Alphaproteobacteria bacterium]|nr:dTMP kinase [Alphaproteobacteria bacterium]